MTGVLGDERKRAVRRNVQRAQVVECDVQARTLGVTRRQSARDAHDRVIRQKHLPHGVVCGIGDQGVGPVRRKLEVDDAVEGGQRANAVRGARAARARHDRRRVWRCGQGHPVDLVRQIGSDESVITQGRDLDVSGLRDARPNCGHCARAQIKPAHRGTRPVCDEREDRVRVVVAGCGARK